MTQHSSRSHTHFIAMALSANLEDYIQDCRSWMQQHYGCSSGHSTVPHITLVPPFALPQEYAIVQLKQAVSQAVQLCVQQKHLPFSVQVNGFGAFAERTLFAHIEAHSSWNSIREILFSCLAHELPGAVRKGKKPFTPHITIANRDIPTGTIDKALMYFAQLELQETFVADTITVFERTVHGTWRVLCHYAVT